MTTEQIFGALLLYIRLVSYPAGAFGVLWLMFWRPDWRTRPTSLIYLSQAVLLIAQLAVVLVRILLGEDAVAAASDAIITPALVMFNLCLWASIIWLSRRWRKDPAALV